MTERAFRSQSLACNASARRPRPKCACIIQSTLARSLVMSWAGQAWATGHMTLPVPVTGDGGPAPCAYAHAAVSAVTS